MVVLCVPVLDITYSTLRRLLRGKNPFVADGDHLHHRLLKAGLSQRKTVFAFYMVCVSSGLLVSHYVHSDWFYLKMVGAVVVLSGILLYLLRLKDLRPCSSPSPTVPTSSTETNSPLPTTTENTP
jgi:UDP-GlcNAc:undecaprenyl-phosphate GlcNAc-1-phosphate transferase